MSRLTIGISGAIALSLISGAAQLALGRDLSPSMLRGMQGKLSSATIVNRAAKADRAVSRAALPAQTRTIAFRLDSFSDTSFLVRVPVAKGGPAPAPFDAKSGARNKPPIACEPMVSVLAEAAKQLPPGRCVT